MRSKQITAVHLFDSILLKMLSVMLNKAVSIEKVCMHFDSLTLHFEIQSDVRFARVQLFHISYMKHRLLMGLKFCGIVGSLFI